MQIQVKINILRMTVLVMSVLLSACSPGSVGVGIYGGSHSGVGVGMSFPWPGNTGSQREQPIIEETIFKQGQIIARNDFYYRRFIGQASNGGFVVQDFYNQNKSDETGRSQDAKLSDIYLLTAQGNAFDGLSANVFDFDRQDWDIYLDAWLNNLHADGVVTLWHANGQKAVNVSYDKQQAEGAYSQWYDNGQLHWEGQYRHGQRVGVWKQWNPSGGLLEEHVFK